MIQLERSLSPVGTAMLRLSGRPGAAYGLVRDILLVSAVWRWSPLVAVMPPSYTEKGVPRDGGTGGAKVFALPPEFLILAVSPLAPVLRLSPNAVVMPSSSLENRSVGPSIAEKSVRRCLSFRY